MRITKKKERSLKKVLQKKQDAYDKFYAEYKDKTLEELKEIFKETKPGGVRKAAILDIVNGKLQAAQAEVVNSVAHDAIRENSEVVPQEENVEEAKVVEDNKDEDTV